jgi:predicted ferric reductase
MVTEKLWWYLARSGGIVAWALLAASVLWGLALASRLFVRRPPAPWLLAVHRWLSGLAVAFTGIHLAGIMLDSYVEFRWLDLVVPFASDWKPLAVAWGVVAFQLLVAVQATSLFKSRLSHRAWRRVHHAALAIYVFSTVHFLTAGTDARSPIVGAVVIAVSGSALALGLVRLWAPRGRLPRPGRTGRQVPART